MKNKSLLALITISLAGLGILGGVAFASNQNQSPTEPFESEVAITGDALKTASEVALTHTGGGRVTETEVNDEESYYEVEVTLANGNQVDVQLDQNFKVIGEKVEKGDNGKETDRN